MTQGLRIVFPLLMLLAVPIGVRCQVDICYDFEDAPVNGRPAGWGALPNLDYHYVGVLYGSTIAHSGTKSLCNNHQTCFTLMPDEGLDYGAEGVWMLFWWCADHSTTSIDIGYVTDATDSNTFTLLKREHAMGYFKWHFSAVDLGAVPSGARVALRGRSLIPFYDAEFFIDDIHLTSQPCAAWGLRVAENGADSVRLEWQSAGAPTVMLTVNGVTHSVDGNSYTFARDADASYTASLIAGCPVTGCMAIQPHSTATVAPYREGACLDATDFGSSMGVPHYGTLIDPWLHVGTRTITEVSGTPLTGVYNGSHAVNTNPGSDVQQGMSVFQRTVPPGDAATLRLGNRTGLGEASSMLYTLTVDTAEASLLVMKYTVAMNTAEHTTSTDPSQVPVMRRVDSLYPARFSVELLDDTLGALPGGGCYSIELDAMEGADAWDVASSYYKRRNFTARAFDLRPWHGRRLRLRVTAASGAVLGCWCYAYYNFECLRRDDIYSGDCSGDSVTLRAPYGFGYRWHCEGSAETVGTGQTLTVAPDGTRYLCELEERFGGCGQTISIRAMDSPTLTESDTVTENELPYTWRGVTFTAGGDTSVMLPAATGCDTILTLRLHVWPNQRVREVRWVCRGAWPVVWHGVTFDGPDSTEVMLTDMHGADSVVTLVAMEAEVYETADTVVVCPGRPFEYMGVDYGGPVSFDTVLPTVRGCDSLVHVVLAPRDSNYSLEAAWSTDGEEWHVEGPVGVCAGGPLWLRCRAEGVGECRWEVQTADTAIAVADTLAMLRIAAAGSGTLTLTATSLGGCTDTLGWKLTIYATPKASFTWSPARPTDISPEASFWNTTRPDSCSWLWRFETAEGGADSTTLRSPTYRWGGVLPSGDFGVSLTAALTHRHDTLTLVCADSLRQEVTVVTSLLQFPSVVTPNGDGVNDRWGVVNLVELGRYTQNEVWIYNQWGVLVYHARDMHSEAEYWDPDERPCPDGTYYYRFAARNDDGVVKCNGVIEVVR